MAHPIWSTGTLAQGGPHVNTRGAEPGLGTWGEGIRMDGARLWTELECRVSALSLGHSHAVSYPPWSSGGGRRRLLANFHRKTLMEEVWGWGGFLKTLRTFQKMSKERSSPGHRETLQTPTVSSPPSGPPERVTHLYGNSSRQSIVLCVSSVKNLPDNAKWKDGLKG